MIWWHQTIIWTNVDFSLIRFCDIQLKAISQASAEAAILYELH